MRIFPFQLKSFKLKKLTIIQCDMSIIVFEITKGFLK